VTAPQQYPLDTGLYLETLEEELVTATNRARVYRTQVKQLEHMLQKYKDHYGELSDAPSEPDTGGSDA
jgi:hypothetical protein